MRNVEYIKSLPFSVKPFKDITDTLIRNDKGTWEPDRTVEQIRRISVHHSGVEGGSPESYARYHVQTLGWRSIGYHMCIVGDQVLQTNSLLSFTYHTSSNNFDTVSVSISGDLSKREMSSDERNCLYAVILTYMQLFNIPIENVLGHREFSENSTSCPCTDMQRIRKDITTILNQLEYAKSEEHAKATAFSIGNNILYVCNMLNGKMSDGQEATPGQKVWAREMLLSLETKLKEIGLL